MKENLLLVKYLLGLVKKYYFDVLDDIVDNYNNTQHATIKMKPIDFKFNSHAEYNIDSNTKDAKSRIGDHVRISRYKNIFVKGYAPNWSEKDFVIGKIKNTVLWTYVNNDLYGKEIAGTIYE